jgi:heat shock protein HslJ
MRIDRRAFVLVPLVLLMLAVSGCGGGSAGDIENVEWRLVGSSVSSTDLGAAGVTARFADGLVGGTGGVNSYGGDYKLGSGGAIELGEIASTLMAGSDEANRAEAAYFALLRDVASYKVDGDTLTLYDAGGNESLIFERAG